MYRLCLIFIFCASVYGENILVDIASQNVVNIVSEKFISFSIDPQILLNKTDSENTEECLCLANLLSPAYLRIAGPSTDFIEIEESIIKFKNNDNTTVDRWMKFMKWMKKAGLTPIFALNNADRFPSGNWNPKTALQALTIIDKSNVGECVWQLGDECRNQTTKEYMEDLQVLKILTDAFASGKKGQWKIASADVNKCLKEDDPKKFSSFLLDSNNFINAAILNSNETNDSLEILSREERHKIHREFVKKDSELWKTISYDKPQEDDAFQWMKTVGNSARDGYAVVFKDLNTQDLEEWSLSYYASLIHKKFVGYQVLNVTMSQNSNISVFGHCGRVPNGPIPNGVTFFAVNDGDKLETIVFRTEMKVKGEIMQFILQKNDNGTVIINNKEMFNENDLKADVREVQPFKAFKVTLPPKSIGFWIIPEANINVCSWYLNTNEIVRKPKRLGTGQIADTLYHIITDNQIDIRRKRSSEYETNDIREREVEMMFKDLKSDIDSVRKVYNNSSNPNDNGILRLMNIVDEMLKLEYEFLNLGRDLLKQADLEDVELFYRHLQDSTSSEEEEHVRVNRDVDEEINLEVKNETVSNKITPIALPKIDLKESKVKIEKLLERARGIIKDLDMKASEDTKVEKILELPKLRSAIRDPGTVVKGELLKHDIKFSELKNKMKARLAEINLKSKLNHKLLKREITNQNLRKSIRKRSVDDVDNRLNGIEGLNSAELRKIAIENNEIYAPHGKDSSEESEEDISTEKLSLEDARTTLNKASDEEGVFEGMVKNLGDFFNNVKERVVEWWNKIG